jgi:hypothetical protein
MSLADYLANENGMIAHGSRIVVLGGVSTTILVASTMMGRIPVVVKATIPGLWKLTKVFWGCLLGRC